MPKRDDDWPTSSGSNYAIHYTEEEDSQVEHLTLHRNESTGEPTLHYHYRDGSDKEVRFHKDGSVETSWHGND